MSWACRSGGAGAAVLLVLAAALGCAALPAEPEGLAGLELEYRFDVGRSYRAVYAEDTVHFRLIEPALADPPAATLPYRVRPLRDGVYLVAWFGEPRFHTTLLIDLPRGELHASALVDGQRPFFETARIVAAVRRPHAGIQAP